MKKMSVAALLEPILYLLPFIFIILSFFEHYEFQQVMNAFKRNCAVVHKNRTKHFWCRILILCTVVVRSPRPEFKVSAKKEMAFSQKLLLRF